MNLIANITVHKDTGSSLARRNPPTLQVELLMKKQTLIIKGSLTDLNSYINAERSNRFKGAALKKADTDYVMYECIRQLKAIKEPVYLVFNWFCQNKKKDKDNISFQKKFILDGIVKAGIIDSDGWNDIQGFTEEFYIDNKNPRIEVILMYD